VFCGAALPGHYGGYWGASAQGGRGLYPCLADASHPDDLMRGKAPRDTCITCCVASHTRTHPHTHNTHTHTRARAPTHTRTHNTHTTHTRTHTRAHTQHTHTHTHPRARARPHRTPHTAHRTPQRCAAAATAVPFAVNWHHDAGSQWPARAGQGRAAAVLLSPSGTTRVPGWLGFSVFLMLSTCGHGASPNGASPNSAASQSIDYF
jgi:hypothetical protein